MRPDIRPTAGPLATAAAVATKTLRTFVGNRQVVIVTLLQGVLFFLVFRYVFGGAIRSGRLSYVDYMTPGIVTAAIIFAATQSAIAVAQEGEAGFTDRLLSLPTSRLGVTIGRVAAHALIVFIAAGTTLIAATATGFRPHAHASQIGLAVVLLLAYSLGFAALFAALGAFASGAEAAQGLAFLAIPATFVSSAYVPTSTMPSWLAAVARSQPVTEMTDALRSLAHANVIGVESSTLASALIWFVAITIASLAAATWRTTRISKS